jgi:hypothetical protein
MARCVVFRIALVLLLMLQPVVQYKGFARDAHQFTQNLDVPFTFQTYNACADELVLLTGRIHFLMHVTIDESGGMSFVSENNFQDVSGIGLTTGTQYRGVDSRGSHTSSSGPSDQVEVTNREVIGLISEDSSPNLRSRFLVHLTFNANGEPTATVVDVSLRCRG